METIDMTPTPGGYAMIASLFTQEYFKATRANCYNKAKEYFKTYVEDCVNKKQNTKKALSFITKSERERIATLLNSLEDIIPCIYQFNFKYDGNMWFKEEK